MPNLLKPRQDEIIFGVSGNRYSVRFMGALEPILEVAKCCGIDDFITSIADTFTFAGGYVLIDIRLFIFSPSCVVKD